MLHPRLPLGGGGGSHSGGPQREILRFNPLHVAQMIDVFQGEKVEPVASMHHQQVDRLQGAPTYLPLLSLRMARPRLRTPAPHSRLPLSLCAAAWPFLHVGGVEEVPVDTQVPASR
jgi:hypothetical protein